MSSIIICPHCKTELDGEASTYCPNCGWSKVKFPWLNLLTLSSALAMLAWGTCSFLAFDPSLQPTPVNDEGMSILVFGALVSICALGGMFAVALYGAHLKRMQGTRTKLNPEVSTKKSPFQMTASSHRQTYVMLCLTGALGSALSTIITLSSVEGHAGFMVSSILFILATIGFVLAAIFRPGSFPDIMEDKSPPTDDNLDP